MLQHRFVNGYRKYFFLVALFVTQMPSYSKTADSTLSAVPAFISQGSRIHPNNTRQEVEQLLGQPLQIETRRIRNAHHPMYVDRLHTYYYNGLAVRFYEAALPGKEFVIAIVLSNPQYRLMGAIGIGSTQSEVIGYLGAPTLLLDDFIIYDATQAGLGRVCLRMESDRVQAIIWDFYFD